MARTIGAEPLGALAERLELAGEAGDARTLFDGLSELLRRFRALSEQLSPLCEAPPEAGEEDESKPLLSAAELREACESLREFSANCDSESAAYILDYLAGFRIPEAERARVNALRRAVEEFDWERVNELTEDGGDARRP